MTVKLEYYRIDETNNSKELLSNDTLSFSNMFKGTQSKIPITMFNAGDTTAISPILSIMQYPYGDYSESYKWKKVSFDKTQNFTTTLKLPDIKPNSWLTGKTVQFEDFNNYPTIAGTKPDMSWMLWGNSEFCWEVYNGWLQHNLDSIDGRALWTNLSKSKDFEFSMRVTVRDGIYAGVILRDEGDSNTGYIVLVQAIATELGEIPKNEGVIQVWDGKFSDGINSWKKIYQSPTIGQRGTHDYFKVKMTDNKFEFWYKNEESNTPLYSYVDNDNLHTKASQPIICCHAGFGSNLTYFDDIKMEVINNDGVVWIENYVDANTSLFGTQYSILEMEYGGVE